MSRVALILACALTGVACSTNRQAAVLKPCHLDGLAEQVQCAVEQVPEDRARPDGRRIGIHVAVLPALRREANPDPLFILAGGPGQGAQTYGPMIARAFTGVRRTRDIVLVDLRGTGDSHPLQCPDPGDPVLPFVRPVDHAAEAARCLAGLDADPRLYTHANALADLDEIRQRLGYRTINLWGGSWGTRAALLYALTYPHAVRRVVLDGAVSMSLAFPAAVTRHTDRALSLMFEACERDNECRQKHGRAREDLNRVLIRLRDAPVRTRFAHPITGAVVDASLTLETFTEVVRMTLYTPADASRLFQALAHAAEGDFSPLAAQYLRTASGTTDTMAFGQTMAVLCSEDVPARVTTESGGDRSAIGRGYVDAWLARCAAWPRGPRIAVDAGATSQAPALILSGQHDPVTPPEEGEAMARHFPNHRHVVVPGAAHNTSFRGCVPQVIAAFIAGDAPADLQTACVDKVRWPGFVLTDAGGL